MSLSRTLPAPADVPAPSRFVIGTSEWWIELMATALARRRARFTKLDRYYRGAQDTQRLASQAYLDSGLATLFPRLNANHSKLVVNGAAQRLVVLGFRLAGELRADTAAADIWARNQMDAVSDMAHAESLVKGECPVLVEPDLAAPGRARITPLDPSDAIVWHAPGDRRIRQAALKTWWDSDLSRRFYVLFLPDRIEQWQDREPGQMDRFRDWSAYGGQPPAWEPRWMPRGQSWQVRNPLGEVPMVVMPNDPRLSGSPEGEHEPALAQIDLYDFFLMNMAHTAKELAFPQRYGVGVELDEGEVQTDETTGEPIAAAPGALRNTPSDIWTVPSPDAKFGQFTAATLDGYVKALDTIRATIATVTFTPYHFLLNMPTSVPPSGESITASEAALVDKVRGHGRDKGAAWREVMALAFRIEGDEQRAAAVRAGKVIWRDPESRTESQHVDALSKLASDPINVPREAIWELIPIPPDEIDRWRRMRAEQDAAEPPAPALPPDVTAPEQMSGIA